MTSKWFFTLKILFIFLHKLSLTWIKKIVKKTKCLLTRSHILTVSTRSTYSDMYFLSTFSLLYKNLRSINTEFEFEFDWKQSNWPKLTSIFLIGLSCLCENNMCALKFHEEFKANILRKIQLRREISYTISASYSKHIRIFTSYMWHGIFEYLSDVSLT